MMRNTLLWRLRSVLLLAALIALAALGAAESAAETDADSTAANDAYSKEAPKQEEKQGKKNKKIRCNNDLDSPIVGSDNGTGIVVRRDNECFIEDAIIEGTITVEDGAELYLERSSTLSPIICKKCSDIYIADAPSLSSIMLQEPASGAFFVGNATLNGPIHVYKAQRGFSFFLDEVRAAAENATVTIQQSQATVIKIHDDPDEEEREDMSCTFPHLGAVFIFNNTIRSELHIKGREDCGMRVDSRFTLRDNRLEGTGLMAPPYIHLKNLRLESDLELVYNDAEFLLENVTFSKYNVNMTETSLPKLGSLVLTGNELLGRKCTGNTAPPSSNAEEAASSEEKKEEDTCKDETCKAS